MALRLDPATAGDPVHSEISHETRQSGIFTLLVQEKIAQIDKATET
jgi:hypothetical protein